MLIDFQIVSFKYEFSGDQNESWIISASVAEAQIINFHFALVVAMIVR